MTFAPDYIQFYPTIRCNLSCDFCFNKTMPFCDDMTLHDFKRAADRLSKLNVRTIDVMGGEPTLHNDIMPVLEYAENKGFRINLSSNGTNPEMLSEIAKRFKSITVGISINEKAMLERLKDFIKQHRPVTKMVFTNHFDMKLLDRMLFSGTEKFYLLYLDVLNKEHINNAMPFSQFLTTVQRLSASYPLGTVYCSGFIPDTLNYPLLSKVRCPAGTTKLGLMPDGSVYPCNLFFAIKELRLGNLLHDSFEKIWNHRLLNFFRTFNGNNCSQTSCILHKTCHGGCPAHSLIHYGSLSVQEPRCNLFFPF